jgi:hypothetical protein
VPCLVVPAGYGGRAVEMSSFLVRLLWVVGDKLIEKKSSINVRCANRCSIFVRSVIGGNGRLGQGCGAAN